MANIVLCRIDSRLIHGQVVTKWVGQSQANRIAVVSDELDADPFMKNIYLMAAPPNIKVDCFSNQSFAAAWKENQLGDGNVLVLFPSLIPQQYKFLSNLIPQSLVSLSAAVFILGMFMFRLNGPETQFSKLLPDRNLAKSIFSVYVILLLVFVYVIPTASQFRTGKRTLQEMMRRAEQMKVPAENIYFYHGTINSAVFYLNRNAKIHTIKDLKALDEVRKAKPGERILLISQHRYFENIPQEQLKKLPLVVQENVFPWDSKKNIRKNYAMRMVLPDNRKVQ